jgi:hypothetical protein
MAAPGQFEYKIRNAVKHNEERIMCQPYVSILFFLLLVPSAPFLDAQTTSLEKSHALRREFIQNIRTESDSIVLEQQHTTDSLSHFLHGVLGRYTLSLQVLADSLAASEKGVLDQETIHAIHQLEEQCANRMNNCTQAQKQTLYDQLTKYKHIHSSLVNIHSACPSCAQPDDFANTLNRFHEEAERSANEFHETVTDQVDGALDALADSMDALRDVLLTFVETHIDHRSEEIESMEAHCNKIIVSMDGKNHTSFRGRDGGVSQASLNPSIALRLSSGIRFTLGAGWTEKPDFHLDNSSLGAAYDFSISPTAGASICYAYLWFSDSSTQNQSVFHHSIDGSIFFETPMINCGAGLGISIGPQIEYALSASISHSLPAGKFSIDPSLTISWGEQNSELVATRLAKATAGNAKGKGVGKGKGNSGGGQQSGSVLTTTKATNVFSVMSYEINLPVTIKIGRVLLTPSLTGVFPINVLDGSRETPFLTAGLTVTLDFLLQ